MSSGPSVGSILGASFALLRTRLVPIIAWGVIYMVATLGFGLAMRPVMQAQVAAMRAGAGAVPAVGTFLLSMLLFYIALFLLFIVLYAAAFRAVLFPERSAAFYLRFAGDELRLAGLMLLLLVGFWIIGIVLLVLLSLIGAAIGAAIGGSTARVGVISVLATLILLIPSIPVLIYFWVRLSLSGPLTLLRGRITIGESWRLSRGRFWTLFGAYFVMWLIIMMVITAIFGIVSGPFLAAMMEAQGNPHSMQQLMAQNSGMFGTLGIGGGIVMGLLGGAMVALIGGVFANATLQLAGSSSVADIFD